MTPQCGPSTCPPRLSDGLQTLLSRPLLQLGLMSALCTPRPYMTDPPGLVVTLLLGRGLEAEPLELFDGGGGVLHTPHSL